MVTNKYVCCVFTEPNTSTSAGNTDVTPSLLLTESKQYNDDNFQKRHVINKTLTLLNSTT